MNNKYERWIIIKDQVNLLTIRPLFHTRDVWFCLVGANIGDEEDGAPDDFVRPVIVIRKFNDHICWVVPLSRSLKKSIFYFEIKIFPDGYSAAILSQLRLVDANRFTQKIGFIPKDVFAEIQEGLKRFLS